MKILLVGGGSGGPVSPLLAIAEEIKKTHSKAVFLLVGGTSGPEQIMAEKASIPFVAISSGKLRRYWSWQNFTSPFFVIQGFFESLKILKSFKPDCVFGTGSFVQVPLVWAAWFLKIPVVLHQQDIYPSLANTVCQICASKITVTFEHSLTDFSSGGGIFYSKKTEKVLLTGNPFKESLKTADPEDVYKLFGLKKDFPIILVSGGGTGAAWINTLIRDSLPQLTKFVQIIHQTGKGKSIAPVSENYYPVEFILDMGSAYAAAEIVVSRAGLSTITELSNLAKISIIIPMPDSHQEVNAYFLENVKAAIIAPQSYLNPERFCALVRKVLLDGGIQKDLKANMAKVMPKNSAQKISEVIVNLCIKERTI